jgi:hypothetical protein
MFTELAIVIFIIIIGFFMKPTKENFQTGPKYGTLDFKWKKNPSDIMFNYINQDNNTIYVPDPATYTNKNLYVVNSW